MKIKKIKKNRGGGGSWGSGERVGLGGVRVDVIEELKFLGKFKKKKFFFFFFFFLGGGGGARSGELGVRVDVTEK